MINSRILKLVRKGCRDTQEVFRTKDLEEFGRWVNAPWGFREAWIGEYVFKYSHQTDWEQEFEYSQMVEYGKEYTFVNVELNLQITVNIWLRENKALGTRLYLSGCTVVTCNMLGGKHVEYTLQIVEPYKGQGVSSDYVPYTILRELSEGDELTVRQTAGSFDMVNVLVTKGVTKGKVMDITTLRWGQILKSMYYNIK